jgi:hypothetical protein
MHKTLTNWKARRAGGRITVTGTNKEGAPDKIVGVDRIEPRHDCDSAVFAFDRFGEVHILKLSADAA